MALGREMLMVFCDAVESIEANTCFKRHKNKLANPSTW